MKLPQLQSILPGRSMMFVALGLSLAIGWYFYNASGVADHLTKRNFNYLNQIGSNIDASIDAAGEYGKFLNKRTMVADIYRQYRDEFKRRSSRYATQSQERKDSLLAVKPPSSRDVLKHAISETFEGMKSNLVEDGHLVSDPKNVVIEISEEQLELAKENKNSQEADLGRRLSASMKIVSLARTVQKPA